MYEGITTACLYARYSSHNQTEQSIEGQVRVCQDFCDRNNIQIVNIYTDRATSASKDIEKRESFLQMIKDAEKHPFDAVIVYKLDRFARSRYDSANYKYKLKKAGVQLISATENITDTPEGIILESVLEGMAEFYSAELSQKVTRGMHESALKHNSIGGRTPLGYKIVDKKYVIDEETAPIVRKAFSMYAEGHSLTEICDNFNARGYKTSKGKEFNLTSFNVMLHNERYVGTYVYKDYRQENAIPAIVSRELFDAVQERLSMTHKPHRKIATPHTFLLAGKIYCGECKHIMYGIYNQLGQGYYTCSQRRNKLCNKKNVKQETIEQLVIGDARSLLTDERIEEIAAIAVTKNTEILAEETDILSMQKRLSEIETSIGNIANAIESGNPPRILVERLKELEKEKTQLQSDLKREETSAVIITKDHIRFFLMKVKSGMSTSDRFNQSLIDMFVRSVTVYENGRVEIVYNLTTLPSKEYKFENSADGSPIGSFQINRCSLVHIVAIEKRNGQE